MQTSYQVAVVTGASTGIGAELARQLGAAGVRVGLIALPEPALEANAASIRALGGIAATAPADVSDRAALQSALGRLAEELGPIELMIANAGVGFATPATAFSAARIEKMVRVNLLGVVYAFEAVLPGMIERGRGHLVGMSSMASYRGQPAFAGYSASKAGLASMLEGLRVELGPLGVAVTTIYPGFVRTPMTAPFAAPKFVMEVEPAARTILGGIAARRAEVHFPRRPAFVFGLGRFLPCSLYDRVARSLIPPPTPELLAAGNPPEASPRLPEHFASDPVEPARGER